MGNLEKINPKLVDPSGRGEVQSDFFSISLPKIQPISSQIITVGVSETYSGDPFGLLEKLNAREDKLKFLFVGITGDLFPRFFGNAVETLVEALPGIKDKIEIVPVGRGDNHRGEEIVNLLRKKFPNIPLADYVSTDDCLKRLVSGDLSVSGTYLATPPNNHLSGTLDYLSANAGPVFCEKPLCLPGELTAYSKLLADYPNQIVPVDCFTTTIPLYWLINTDAGRDLLGRFGSAAIFNGTVAEQQEVEIRRLGGNLGLLREAISGGGIGLDCGVHSYAMARATLESLGVSPQKTRAIFTPSTYLDTGYLKQNLDAGYHDIALFRETAGLAQLVGDHTVINAQGMKGVHTTAYCLDIISHAGERIVVSLGTDTKYPYLVYVDKEGAVEVRTFSAGYRPDVGYTGTLYSMLSFMTQQRGDLIFPKLPAITNACHGAVEIFGEIGKIPFNQFEKYEIGHAPQSSIPIPTEIDDLVPAK